MAIDLDRRIGGVALLVGYLLLGGLLYWRPGAGVGAAMASLRGIVYFLVFPVAGLAAGVYVILEGPYNGVFLFLAANYLAVFGLALALGFTGLPPLGSVLGMAMVALAIVAIFVSFAALISYVRLTPADTT